MDIQSRTLLLRSLLAQLSEDAPRDAAVLEGDPARVMIGLRDLAELGLISGQLSHGEQSDGQGLLLVSATGITLTRRGAAFKAEP
ncbi:hypothetical protein ACSC9U_10440 [Pseudomonas solani]|uniref:Uncharacterized protein n=2 Tax=Pseudomonas solani TaxID=2731552 RepID=A0AAU7XUS4_9PSED|nr:MULTISPECIES: hypothetical protein [Pseudomonas]EQM66969.1 hypothetical protein L682_23995 [Pseudomonas alcaligenes OT 69]MBB4821013.1 hypothetical protein [Pseudomonas alcaligenes]MDN4149626.1 hypothetical protein [Pseudomonas tohonis]MDU9412629.1 hypothetical protein [Pseudomonas sp. zfem005]WCD83399.1 hypothetical protein PI990_15635 [Pseudomonas sp. TUM22785]